MKKLLIYYGYLNSFNSAQNQWNNENVAQEMKNYDLLVFGDGVQETTHPDYSNSQTIINRIKVLNPNAKIFGYVTINQEKADFQSKVEKWNDLGVHGIFLDEAGYDYGSVSTNGREAFNEKVSFVHSQDSANLCFANAWNPDHVLNNEDDASYPNSTYNPNDNNTMLDENDFFLLESFPVNTDSYSASNNVQPIANWGERIGKVVSLNTEVSLIASGIIADNNADGQDLFNILLANAYGCGLDGVGSSDTSYGSSSAKTKMWNRFTV